MFRRNLINSFKKKSLSINDFELQTEQLTLFLKENGGNHVSHLIFLQDKEFFWTNDHNMLIVYKQIGNKLIVLGDPIGDQARMKDSIMEFCEYSKRNGLKPVFYQISPQNMQYYHDYGYRFIKLGEEGIVDLKQFSMEGKQRSKLRIRFNKFSRNGYSFRVEYAPYSDTLLSEIKNISDEWLGDQEEKGFSVVSFSKEYVSRFPIALLSDSSGKTIAFATLATDYKQTISIDLMRKALEIPHGTMDALFVHILQWAKINGYEQCSLGMSPLSNVGTCQHSFLSEKLIHLAYLYGNSLYNFKGLREFKNKFASTWEPKYLAYKGTFLPVTFIQLLLIINFTSNPLNRMVRKVRCSYRKPEKEVLFD